MTGGRTITFEFIPTVTITRSLPSVEAITSADLDTVIREAISFALDRVTITYADDGTILWLATGADLWPLSGSITVDRPARTAVVEVCTGQDQLPVEAAGAGPSVV